MLTAITSTLEISWAKKYIGDKIAGENGFGYDPIFCVEKYGCTTAELSEEQKNEISHRGKALRAMKEKLAKENL